MAEPKSFTSAFPPPASTSCPPKSRSAKDFTKTRPRGAQSRGADQPAGRGADRRRARLLDGEREYRPRVDPGIAGPRRHGLVRPAAAYFDRQAGIQKAQRLQK